MVWTAELSFEYEPRDAFCAWCDEWVTRLVKGQMRVKCYLMRQGMKKYGLCPQRGSCGRCVRGILCQRCDFNELPRYERNPRRRVGLRNPLIDAYLSDPPARSQEAKIIRGRDDTYLPTSWSFIHDEHAVEKLTQNK
ncbi:hypothetical protein [Streptomyces cinereospinus]|uniref:Uncharacterized protein n=1 Tax=Streptomyces cinereospinus TaxID=285561 RepID=A0ABV5N309_9ACTN